MVFARENRRAGRSPPLINSKIHTIIVPEHRAKTPRTEEKEKENWGTAHPLTNAPRDCISRSAPLTLMNLFLLRGSADFFSLEKLEGKSHFF